MVPALHACAFVTSLNPQASTCVSHLPQCFFVAFTQTDNLLRTVRAKQKASARADDNWCVELRYNGGDARQMSHWMVPFKPSAEHRDTIWRPQADGDLGHKMAEAIGTAFMEGARRVVVVSKSQQHVQGRSSGGGGRSGSSETPYKNLVLVCTVLCKNSNSHKEMIPRLLLPGGNPSKRE